MSDTQIQGVQIRNATITSVDLASGAVTPAKISAVITDDFVFPRDVTVARNLIVSNNLINTHTIPSVGADTFTLNNAAQTLLNKTISFASNTLTNVVSTNTTQSITGQKTFTLSVILDGGVTATGSSISFNSKNFTSVGTINSITLPVSTGSFLVTDVAQTIVSNKTFDPSYSLRFNSTGGGTAFGRIEFNETSSGMFDFRGPGGLVVRTTKDTGGTVSASPKIAFWGFSDVNLGHIRLNDGSPFDTFVLNISGADKLTIDTTTTNFASNNLTGVGNINTHPLPSGSGAILSTDATQILTNKTIDSATNTVKADKLTTTGAAVVVSASAPPTTGQVLTATSAIAATWQTPVTSGHVIQDETVSVTTRGKLNFIGNAVKLVDNSGNDSSDVSISYTNIVLSDDSILSEDDEIVTSD